MNIPSDRTPREDFWESQILASRRTVRSVALVSHFPCDPSLAKQRSHIIPLDSKNMFCSQPAKDSALVCHAAPRAGLTAMGAELIAPRIAWNTGKFVYSRTSYTDINALYATRSHSPAITRSVSMIITQLNARDPLRIRAASTDVPLFIARYPLDIVALTQSRMSPLIFSWGSTSPTRPRCRK
ncbi:hypothetical protein OH76DRAFT_93713 [Lentinus brumalis]|uniref:Uncharacterized protein n=1 Tax=Lentinus brumalis TaxID=2498619 RepID=A0A371CQU1_9APHY|nr:hypothetical protein OH76DRAFT_93713 [Polyporus brumalis]